MLADTVSRQAVYDPLTFPDKGMRRMCAFSDDGDLLTSDVLVVHTWCAICLLQVSSRTIDEWRDRILKELLVPSRVPYGIHTMPQECCTFDTHPCVFCGDKGGWTTFCFYHLSKKAGCRLCRSGTDVPARLVTKHSFHPSCAVWAGMQRLSRKEGFGMLCAQNKTFRSQHCPHLKEWLDFVPGINEFLPGHNKVSAFSLVPEETSGCKGLMHKKKH